MLHESGTTKSAKLYNQQSCGLTPQAKRSFDIIVLINFEYFVSTVNEMKYCELVRQYLRKLKVITAVK